MAMLVSSVLCMASAAEAQAPDWAALAKADVEGLLLRQGDVAVDAGRAAHDVDGVDVELARHSRRLLRRAVGEHPHPRHEHDERVGAAHRGTVGVGVRVAVRVCASNRSSLVAGRSAASARGR